MKSTLQFCDMIGIDQKTAREIDELERKVSALCNDKVREMARVSVGKDLDRDAYLTTLERVESLGESIGEHPYRMQMIFALYCFQYLEEEYKKAGLSSSVYEQTMVDFRFRVEECQEVYGFTGIFVAFWYVCFCNLSLQRFGDFEFEKRKAFHPYQGNGYSVTEEDDLYSLHIPPNADVSEASLTRALKAHYDYFGLQGIQGYQCYSWLLYPGYDEVFVPGGNIQKFRKFFTHLQTHDTATFKPYWRIFKVAEMDDLEALPRNTRLQENMYQYLKAGKPVGDGVGQLLFDGEKIIK